MNFTKLLTKNTISITMKIKPTLIVTIILILPFLLLNCKSAKKALKKGNYDESVLLAVDKLRSNSDHQSSIDILKNAYSGALQQHLNSIDKNKTSTDILSWENIFHDYQALNKLYDAISACSACMQIAPARNYYNEEKSAREKATQIRYQEGNRYLEAGGRENARIAYNHFEVAQSLTDGYENVNNLLEQAYSEASYKIVVEQVLVTSKSYQLSNEYFQREIDNFLKTNKKINKFVQFYTPEEATEMKLQPDHVLTLQFDDFVVGQTLIERNTKAVEKDSVKIGETKIRDRPTPVYGKVKADFTAHRKSVHSSGLLDLTIRDFKQNKVVQNKKFEGSFDWRHEWGTFKGDERALNDNELKLSKIREQNPPPPQQLFIEFSKPLYSQVTSYLRNYYSKY